MRFLLETSTSNTSNTSPSSPPLAIDSDIVVILAALLCALICFVGLSLVVRCAFIRQRNRSSPSKSIMQKGLNKKSLQSLPTLSLSSTISGECVICLGDFVEGERIRVLPPCGHGFHVECVDTWLGAHNSCPSCRTVLVVPVVPAVPERCCKCGASNLNGESVEASDGSGTGGTGTCNGALV
ncbi:hypothetical protein LUZ60_007048 [Juncus effusus]|nr:hypothetical protein LUZ60_007048 [Juncus effusus]